MMNGLDLFSGIGGNTLGLGRYINTVVYCENDRHAQSVLLSRMGDGSIKPAPIWDNISKLTAAQFDIPIDIIVGGFPCQDISTAGKGAGLGGKRSGLFYEVCRLVETLNPRFVFLENVPAIRTRGLFEVVRALTDLGYDCRWTCVSAAEVGAPHIRKRWFLLAHTKVGGDQRELRGIPQTDASEVRSQEQHQDETWRSFDAGKDVGWQKTNDSGWWKFEPNVDRMVDGFPGRVDRLKRLGNAVVPVQAKEAFERLMGLTAGE